mmetsp:Transcript_50790/g.147970  ORF Transcript_50790/g.147970 Transcript_50790/m.147970 type:complete len:263 (+) Transcript_50790:864-1652(+)
MHMVIACASVDEQWKYTCFLSTGSWVIQNSPCKGPATWSPSRCARTDRSRALMDSTPYRTWYQKPSPEVVGGSGRGTAGMPARLAFAARPPATSPSPPPEPAVGALANSSTAAAVAAAGSNAGGTIGPSRAGPSNRTVAVSRQASNTAADGCANASAAPEASPFTPPIAPSAARVPVAEPPGDPVPEAEDAGARTLTAAAAPTALQALFGVAGRPFDAERLAKGASLSTRFCKCTVPAGTNACNSVEPRATAGAGIWLLNVV